MRQFFVQSGTGVSTCGLMPWPCQALEPKSVNIYLTVDRMFIAPEMFRKKFIDSCAFELMSYAVVRQ